MHDFSPPILNKIYDQWDNERLVSDQRWSEPTYVSEKRHPFFTVPVNVDYKIVDTAFIAFFAIIAVVGIISSIN